MGCCITKGVSKQCIVRLLLTIPAKSHIGIHGLTKIKHGGWSVNVVNENPQITPLPHGLKTESTLSQLSPES